MGEWPEVRIESIAERVAMGPFGSSIKVETFVPSGIPVVSGQHLHGVKLDDSVGFNFVTVDHAERLKNANVQRGDVIFTHAGNIGQVAYIPNSSKYDRYVISQRQFYLRCDRDKVIPEFIVSYFKTKEGQHRLLANASQVGVPSIAQPVTYLRTIKIPLPPLDQQRAIAQILGTLDDRIEANRRIAATLEEMARALFRAWFVTFEPIRAKAEGRWQPGQSLPGLPATLYNLFPDRLVEAGRGQIPEGWELVPYGTLLESSIGGDWGQEEPDSRHTEAAWIIRGTDFPQLRRGAIQKSPKRYLEANRLSKRRLQEGDSVIEISGGSPTQPTGRSIYVTRPLLDRFDAAVVPASFCRRFRPIERWLGVILYLHLDLLYSNGGTWAYQNQSTGIANFQTSHFLESEFVVKPRNEIGEVFSSLTEAMLEQAGSNVPLSIRNLRDALLPKLVSGEIKVKDAEAFLKERGL